MRLSNRISVTFVLLLAAVLATTLTIVSRANEQNATRETDRQLDVATSVLDRVLESNQRQLQQATQVLAQDFGFRTAIATADTATIRSALENHGGRIGASMAVLADLQGRTMAAIGVPDAPGGVMHLASPSDSASRGGGMIALQGGRIHQLV